MQILTQFASVSYSLNPPRPAHLLLPAPRPMPRLAAPQRAGLLPATTPRAVEIVVERRPTPADLRHQLGPIRTRAEMDAEIADMLDEAMTVLRGMREYRIATARRSLQEVWA